MGEVFLFVLEDGCIFKHCAKTYQGKSLKDERFRRARAWTRRARRPGSDECLPAMLRKYPSGNPNHKIPPPTPSSPSHTKPPAASAADGSYFMQALSLPRSTAPVHSIIHNIYPAHP